jgi:hypothetical protein
MRAFVVAANAAVDHGLRMSLVTKAGEVFEGVPEAVAVDHTNGPASVTLPDERHLYGPREDTIEIDGREILAQEVAQFTLTLR